MDTLDIGCYLSQLEVHVFIERKILFLVWERPSTNFWILLTFWVVRRLFALRLIHAHVKEILILITVEIS